MARNGSGGVVRGPKSEVRGRKTAICVDPSRPLRVGIRGWFWALEGSRRAENWGKTTKSRKNGPETAFCGVWGALGGLQTRLSTANGRKFTQMGNQAGRKLEG